MVTSEPDVYEVGSAYNRGWQGGAVGLSHQSGTVSIRNCQVVAAFLGVKCNELQYHHHSVLHLYSVRLVVEFVWIDARMIWRGDNTWGKDLLMLGLGEIPVGTRVLTITATAISRTNSRFHLPVSGASGRVQGARVDVLTKATAANITRIVTVQISRGSAWLARSGREWRRAECSWKMIFHKINQCKALQQLLRDCSNRWCQFSFFLSNGIVSGKRKTWESLPMQCFTAEWYTQKRFQVHAMLKVELNLCNLRVKKSHLQFMNFILWYLSSYMIDQGCQKTHT